MGLAPTPLDRSILAQASVSPSRGGKQKQAYITPNNCGVNEGKSSEAGIFQWAGLGGAKRRYCDRCRAGFSEL